MSLKSNDVHPVSAELVYETPDKRRKTSSRKAPEKAPEPEINVLDEVERIFFSRFKLVRQVETEMRRLKAEVLEVAAPVFGKMATQTRGKHPTMMTSGGVSHAMCYPLSRLCDDAQRLRIEFERLEYVYHETLGWANDFEGGTK